jgi:hypothetical protein
MADNQHTPNNRPFALTAGDIGSLADRLLARGASTIFAGQPETARDMVVAGRTLRRLMKMLESIRIISDTATVQLID